MPVYRRIADLLLSALMHGRGAHIEGAGRMSPFTHPGEVAQFISDHIERAVP